MDLRTNTGRINMDALRIHGIGRAVATISHVLSSIRRSLRMNLKMARKTAGESARERPCCTVSSLAQVPTVIYNWQ